MMGGTASVPKRMIELIQLLQQKNRLTSPRVAEAMAAVDRGDFVHSSHTYVDHPLDIGFNATISAPHMHAYALERLESRLKPGAKILDVGSGSGYLTACMSLLAGDMSTVYGIEHIPQLIEASQTSINKHHSDLIQTGRILFIQGDGREGLSQYAPYDAIHVGAASPELPQILISQLALGGRMLIPVGPAGDQQFIMIVDKDDQGKVTITKGWSVVYIPLTSKTAQYPR